MGVEINSGFLVYIVIYAVIYFKCLIAKRKIDLIIYSLFIIYMFIVLDLTLFPIPLTKMRVSQLFELKKELEISTQINITDIQLNKQFFYNIVMFIPFGVFINILFFNDNSLFKTILFSFLFSFSIESVQLITIKFLGTFRVFDINDLLANTLGGFVGVLLLCILKLIGKGVNYYKKLDET